MIRLPKLVVFLLSGLPNWCKTEQDVDKYLHDYYENEGIRLDREKIVRNEGLRSIAKLLLNSMWGRYCLQTNKTQYKMIHHPKDLYEMLLNDQFIINDIHTLSLLH